MNTNVHLKTIYKDIPEYQNIRALFTIHNIEYQGKYSTDLMEDLFGISNEYTQLLEYNGCLNLMKGAIEVFLDELEEVVSWELIGKNKVKK